jgi:hypothetical protein
LRQKVPLSGIPRRNQRQSLARPLAGESTIVRKLLVSVLVVLMALGAFSVTKAQDGLPWTVQPDPGQNVSDTAEFHTYAVETLHTGQCIGVYVKVVDSVGSVPDNFEVFVQRGDNRYVSDIHKHLSVGLNQIPVSLKALKLKDKPTADVFDPTQGDISDLGLHLWDPEHQMNLTVTRLYVYDCDTGSQPNTALTAATPAATHKMTSLCVENVDNIAPQGQAMYVFFPGNLTRLDPTVYMIDNGVKIEITVKLDSYVEASASTKYQLPQLDLKSQPTFAAVYVC